MYRLVNRRPTRKGNKGYLVGPSAFQSALPRRLGLDRSAFCLGAARLKRCWGNGGGQEKGGEGGKEKAEDRRRAVQGRPIRRGSLSGGGRRWVSLVQEGKARMSMASTIIACAAYATGVREALASVCRASQVGKRGSREGRGGESKKGRGRTGDISGERQARISRPPSIPT